MNSTLLPLAGLFVIATSALPLAAVDHDHADYLPRVGVQVLAGTSGIEPGIFAEWRLSEACVQLRPELFVNEDSKVGGGGGALVWEPGFIHLPERHALAIGPRAVFHNSDRSGWEVDLMVIWSMDLDPSQRGRHFLEVIGAVGVLEDEDKDEDEDDSVIGASIGIGYGFQF
ncbi:MAG: hypothetical protein H0W78_00685 [Planctomycetes bacterium]|nr:hypothetical protein [Planctomycetota bacterium]